MVELLQRIGEDGQVPNLYPLVKAEALHERLLEPLKKLERSDPPLQFDIYIHLAQRWPAGVAGAVPLYRRVP